MPLTFDDAIYVVDQTGTALFTVDLQDDSYIGCASGWRIDHGTGDAEFGDLRVRGVQRFCDAARIETGSNDAVLFMTDGFGGVAQLQGAGSVQLITGGDDIAVDFPIGGSASISSPADSGIDFSFLDHYVVGIAGNSGTIGHNYGGDVPIALKSSGDAYTTIGHRTPLMLMGTATIPFGQASIAVVFGFTFPAAPRVICGSNEPGPQGAIGATTITTTQFLASRPAGSTGGIPFTWQAAWNI